MNKYLKTSLIYWPLAIAAIVWLSNLGPPIFKNPAGQGLWHQNYGFPISRCYNGSFDATSFGGACSDLAPLINNILINFGAAVIVYLVIILWMKFRKRGKSAPSQGPTPPPII